MSMTTKNFWLLIPLVILLLVFVAENANLLNSQVDDAYISYRYADNFANGLGLVFNPGERVEGYTNLLWVLLVSLGIKLGIAADQFGFGLSIAFSIALLIATFSYAEVILPAGKRALAILAPAILLASNAFVMWSTSGLETPLFALLVVSGFIASRRSKRTLVLVCCVLAVLTRPDGVLLAVILLGVPLLQAIVQQKGAVLRWEYWWEVGLYAIACLVLTLWRLSYYGEFIPNTFYAKVGGVPLDAGLMYIWEFLLDGAIFLLVPFCFAMLFTKELRLESLFLVLVVLYCCAVAGDVFPFSRFFLPVLPLLAAGAVLGIAACMHRLKFLAALSMVSVACSLLWYVYGPTMDKYALTLDFSRSTILSPAKRAQAKAERNGESYFSIQRKVSFLRTIVDDKALIAALAIGRLGYLVKNPILDVLGLTNKTISHSDIEIDSAFLIPGHQRTDGGYVFAQLPEVILIPPKNGTPLVLPVLAELWSHGDLRHYTYDSKLMGYRRVHTDK